MAYKVHTTDGSIAHVVAEYFRVEDGLIVFKNALHKPVAAFSQHQFRSATHDDTFADMDGKTIIRAIKEYKRRQGDTPLGIA